MVFLKAQETRNVMLSIFASVIAGTVTVLIAGSYIARKASETTITRTMSLQQQPRIQENVYNSNMLSYGMNIDNFGDKSKQKLTVSITTSDFYNNMWNPVLVHTFYAGSEEELENLIQTHKTTDKFFDASFKGVFNWKGTEIKLKNSDPKLLYV